MVEAKLTLFQITDYIDPITLAEEVGALQVTISGLRVEQVLIYVGKPIMIQLW